jgi:hypothetical protein
VYIFDAPEGFLPELELDGGRELREARIEMVLECFRVSEIDRMRLVRVLRDIGKVQAEGFAEPSELDLALVFEAETESLLGDLLRHAPRQGDRIV